MNHKENLEYLKKDDPITYYELTSDPTGGGGDDGSELIVLAIVVILIISFILWVK